MKHVKSQSFAGSRKVHAHLEKGQVATFFVVLVPQFEVISLQDDDQRIFHHVSSVGDCIVFPLGVTRNPSACGC